MAAKKENPLTGKEIELGAEIRLTTYLNETFTGQVEAYDPQNDLLVIKSYLSPKCYDFRIVNLRYVTIDSVDGPETSVPTVRPVIDIAKTRERTLAEVDKKIRDAKRRANPSADHQARAVFGAVDKTLRCEWIKDEIHVLGGAAIIREPFSSEAVVGEERTVAQVRKIVGGEESGRGAV
eukprot:m.190553 g.190553  ORF g.190553 m.190553 type:complete len:179 (+) comp39433_c1_seq38:1925-2461(+)